VELQTALNDVLPPSREKLTFEQTSSPIDQRIGQVTLRQMGKTHAVYDANQLGPNLFGMAEEELSFWVKAQSVWNKAIPIMRPITQSEVFAIWDYEGKLLPQEFDESDKLELLLLRLKSPLAKIIRDFAFRFFKKLQTTNQPIRVIEDLRREIVEKFLAEPIVLSPLEAAENVRVAATLPDDAEADLSLWSYDGETEEEAEARKIFRRMIVKWWAWNLEQEAWKWWKANGQSKQDAAAISDAIKRAKAASYWQWIRGSRLFFWRFPKEWQAEMRDGIEFWHLAEPPSGKLHNIPMETREQEMILRRKIFRLKFQWYLEHGYVK